MNRKLLNLLARNAKRGEFRAESGDSGNTIYVYDVIVAADADADWFGGVSAESFVKTLAGMSGDVAVRINSPGGDVFGGKAMAAAIREYRGGTVTVHVDGYAASAASYVATSAGKTIVAPGSMLMIHKAWTIDLGNADDFRKTAELLDKIDGTIAADYAASATRRGKDATDFIAAMAAETWYTAEEAVAAGLADEVSAEKVQAKLAWDLSAYDHAPKSKDEATFNIAIDTKPIIEALDAHVAQIRAELGLRDPEEDEESPGSGGPTDDEIEARRRMSAAIGLRTTA